MRLLRSSPTSYSGIAVGLAPLKKLVFSLLGVIFIGPTRTMVVFAASYSYSTGARFLKP